MRLLIRWCHRAGLQKAPVRRALSAMGVVLFTAASAHAETLRDAVEKAWERQPTAQAQSFRTAELAARVKAANAWMPALPSIGLSERSDRLNRKAGSREVEADLSVPLWLPGQRQRESAVAAADQNLQRDALDSAKWKLAGEVRDAYWQVRSTEAERRAVLRQEADARGIFLSDEVMDFILARFSRDLNSLMQLLQQLDGYSLATKRAITIPLVKSMLESL